MRICRIVFLSHNSHACGDMSLTKRDGRAGVVRAASEWPQNSTIYIKKNLSRSKLTYPAYLGIRLHLCYRYCYSIHTVCMHSNLGTRWNSAGESVGRDGVHSWPLILLSQHVQDQHFHDVFMLYMFFSCYTFFLHVRIFS